MKVWNGPAGHWLRYRCGLAPADTQTTEAERECLVRHARGRRSLVELGVMHGVNTALLRGVMADDGVVTGVDPHLPGRLLVSFERLVARHELARHPRGRAVLLRKFSHDAAIGWNAPIDFLFVDGDHSWTGIERDWRDWTPHIVPGGIVALHDSLAVAAHPDLDSVRFTKDVARHDPRFRVIDVVDTVTVLQRVAAPSP